MSLYCEKYDLLIMVPEDDLIELCDDEKTSEDLQDSKIVSFVCDTANASGHFVNAEEVPVALGPGKVAGRVVTGTQFRILSTWFTITGITGEGSSTNQVAFSGTLGTGTFEVDMLASSLATERITRAIEDACSEVDNILSRRYQVPVSPIPDFVRKCAVDIAIWNVYSRKNQEFNREEDSSVRIRYRNAIKELKLACEEGGTLGIDIQPISSGNKIITVQGPERVFTSESMNGW